MISCRKVISLVVVSLWSLPVLSAEELCIYSDSQGVLQQVRGKESVPTAYAGDARCFESKVSVGQPKGAVSQPIQKKKRVNGQAPGLQTQHGYLAAPTEIDLEGTTRKENISSQLGRIELRWPRSVELLFGRTPLRAMQDAAAAASRALKSSGFPQELQNLTLDWNVVFMDERLPVAQIPNYLVNNCHPAWMTPPSNIYVVAQRVSGGCGGQKADTEVADAALAHILIHEIGHAVEFQLLQGRFADDRMRAEGFASWFESFGADFSAVIRKGSVKAMYLQLAQQSLANERGGSFQFNGGATDYARASLYFHAVADRRGVRGIAEVYELMRTEGLGLEAAIKKRLGWTDERLAKELRNVAAGL
jgi:hypothetical protein